jgi:hypothetical protein
MISILLQLLLEKHLDVLPRVWHEHVQCTVQWEMDEVLSRCQFF